MPVAMSIPIPEEDVAVLAQKHSPGSRKEKALSLASKNLDPLDEKGVDLMVGDSNVPRRNSRTWAQGRIVNPDTRRVSLWKHFGFGN
jgi:hypothetical protein